MLCKNGKDLPGEKSVDKTLSTPPANAWLGIIITRAEDKTIKRAVIMLMSE